MTKLRQLYEAQGQSPWLDNLKRSYLEDGTLARRVAAGVRGVTSNPTIFAKAISGETTYDEEFTRLAAAGPVLSAYWTLVSDDVRGACEVLRPVHKASGGADGFVSLEVAPELAHDTQATIEAARSLHESLRLANLFVKIPATAAGVPAIEAMVAEGRNINVTLIFSIPRYREVMEAYLSGLSRFAAAGGDPGRVAGVASFFVSRVDTEVDRRLEALDTAAALALRGRAAVAQAKIAYDAHKATFAGPRWQALADAGARVQRPLWASTSTKNQAYPDLLYVDNLVGPDTVNTMPDATIDAFLDHGEVARTVDRDLDDAFDVMASLAAVGVDMDDVARVLEDEGVAAFAKSYDELIEALSAKASASLGAS